ncbi:unnamed protein product [Polarella glacialis]|uniref:Uncharacterized protein n=1 Tax=Polarella glacialis TaxID=89957 RepID=A0A813IVG7_POLGL|nr:unnamed protein product [Polarella glacialis]
MYADVLQGPQHEFVNRFLETAPCEQREQFSGMVRSLHNLRRAKARQGTVTHEAFDLQENARLWPVFETSECNLSRVPLGSMTQSLKTLPPPSPLLHLTNLPHPPPSPTVSGLGSLPLTRLSTPLMVTDLAPF